MATRLSHGDLTIDLHGAERWYGVAIAHLPAIERALAELPREQAGIRLTGMTAIAGLLGPEGGIGALVARHLGSETRAVRMILFDKSPAANWTLGWHQDRTIVVRDRIEVDGYGPWTVKSGLLHVAPPIELLERMITIRIHLDPVSAANAPLLIAPKSHRLGRVPETAVMAAVVRHGIHPCIAQAGDIWAYSTPILHASDAAAEPRRRRVLQIDYAGEELPGGLEWLGI